jgi:3,4-dihydroxy 2-butanone 4-phosphate synthase/GTP cyclohydrolase II
MTVHAKNGAGSTPRGYLPPEVVPGDSSAGAPSTADHAIAAIRRGETVVLIDDLGGGVGLIVVAAEFATSAAMAFVVRYCSGFVCVGLTTARTAELGIPDMVHDTSGGGTAPLSVSFDYVHGTTTGISAFDRSRTAMSLVDSGTRTADLARPGHLHALRAHDDGVLGRPGRAEAAVDLARLAGLSPGGVLCELVSADGLSLMGGAEALTFAAEHRLVAMNLSELVRHRRQTEMQVVRTSEAVLATERAEFTCVTFESTLDEQTHYAFVLGHPAGTGDPLVVLHRECVAADVFGSTACGCARHLADAMATVATAGEGVVLYLRGGDGLDITLDHPRSRTDAADVDDRIATVATRILAALGIANERPVTSPLA